jgi:hypothetical protein
VLLQVIDAMEDKGDCQPEHLSRKLQAPSQRN